MSISIPAPEWQVLQWMNTPEPLSLAALRGRVVLVIAFQMLCPGCVSLGLPQALCARKAFVGSGLAVIGLHTVFEHHEAQGSRAALAAFLHEYRIGFPVGIDAPSAYGGLPQTMQAYNMQGTPTTLLIDRAGRLRLHHFGHIEDMELGATIGRLLEQGA
ncbi:redoxin domain-containing protein [Candidimonas humi]|jgi:hypothetical protein|uniref:Redoxin domain-containing protein n=1 Tax=Candidimonas humi TaxID=683355 RepID=A0ABV8NWP5_9BURK|nr:redoxin domain-containing protein [Candidimonas humi]MBV6304638.1 redoxin domain-containing protein [Candidimonas humi]